MSVIGDKIKLLRTEKGWTVRELGVKTDIEPSMIIAYESGSVKPRYIAMVKLSRAFGLTMDEFSKELAEELRAGNHGTGDLHFDLQLFDQLVQQLHGLDDHAKASLTPLLRIFVDQIGVKYPSPETLNTKP